MKNKKQMGIWMDHSNAFLMEFTGNTLVEHVILSEFTHQDKVETLNKNEKIMHNKQQGQLASYYKSISDIIINCNDVLLFGSTEAKNELYNLLRANRLFDDIKIEVRTTDKIDDTNMHSTVLEYFKTRT